MFSDSSIHSSPRPSHHLNASRSSFANPWPQSWLSPTSLLSLPFVRAEPFNRPDIEPIKTITPDWNEYEERLADGLRFTWLGHAVCMSCATSKKQSTQTLVIVGLHSTISCCQFNLESYPSCL